MQAPGGLKGLPRRLLSAGSLPVPRQEYQRKRSNGERDGQGVAMGGRNDVEGG